MEVLEMDGAKKAEARMTSAAAFVEGGVQDSCEDACSICLEEFCESDPSTVTGCKHEYHLQCILEWLSNKDVHHLLLPRSFSTCQRSSDCPMCLQPISLNDPTSQELLEAVERERKLRAAPPRNATIFHHPTLGDFELQHLPIGATDAELEERIIQHLAAAAAMGRTRHFGRREGHRNRSSSHGRPHFLVFSTHPSTEPSSHVSSSRTQVGGENEPAAVTVASPSSPLTPGENEPSQHILQFSPVVIDQSSSTSGPTITPTNPQGISINDRSSPSHSSLPNQDRAGPSEFQSFSESLKARLNAVSMRYRESFSRSTRGWKERLFSRNSSMSDIGSEVRRELNAGISSVSRMMERLETRDDTGPNLVSTSGHSADRSVSESNQNNREIRQENPLNEGSTPTCAASSVST